VTGDEHSGILHGVTRAIREHDWDALGDYFHTDAVLEFPQSGERFTGLENIRAQFENYPNLEPGSTELHDIIGGRTFALTPMYTVIAVEGSGNRGTAVLRIRYPDQSRWWAINVYELHEGLISRSRNFFAPEFDPPEWRAPYRDKV
jgi:hypothetical protein